MSSLTLEQVDHIASLARLELSASEKHSTTIKLNNIFELIEQMQSVDTKGVEPMSHPQDVIQRLRVDAVTEQNRREVYQSIAPLTQDGLYLVPQVIGSE